MMSDFVFLVFINDFLLLSCSIVSLIALILDPRGEFGQSKEGNFSAYIGNHVTKHTNFSIELTQPAFVQHLVKLLGTSVRKYHREQ